MNLRKFLFPILFLGIAVLLLSFFYSGFESKEQTQNNENLSEIFIDGKKISVEIAQTYAERVKGLSGREDVPGDGLLFVFENDGLHGIWMKEMNFPIDIIWIDKNFKVVDIKKEVKPETYPEVFKPKPEARYVLETEANFSESFGISIGSEVTF